MERVHEVHSIEKKKKTPKGYMWSGRRLTKIQATTRPENFWPEVWSKMGEAAQKKEKQEWANEKPKLDNARKLRGIYFIDPVDGENKETIKNAWKKLEVPMDAAMPCKKKTKKHSGLQETEAKSDESNKIPKTKHACIVEARECRRKRLESSLPKIHEDRKQRTLHKFIPMPQAIPDAKAAVRKEWNKLETIPAWQLDKVKSKKERLYWKHKETTRKSTLLH